MALMKPRTKPATIAMAAEPISTPGTIAAANQDRDGVDEYPDDESSHTARALVSRPVEEPADVLEEIGSVAGLGQQIRIEVDVLGKPAAQIP